MNKIFRIDFYPHDWLTQTGHMTIQQRGLFIQVCAMIYANQGKIKNDAHHIGRVANCSSRMARALIDQLTQQGDLLIRGDFVTQKRCESELNSKRTLIERGAKGGRKSSEKRGEYNKNNDISSSQHENRLPSTTLPYPSSIEVDTGVSPSILPPIPPKQNAYLIKYIFDETILSFDGFFERMWLAYPNIRSRGHKGKAKDELVKKLNMGDDYEAIAHGVARYFNYCKAKGEPNKDFFRWIRDSDYKHCDYSVANNRGAGEPATSGETNREQRRRALAEAAVELGLIQPGDVSTTELP